MKDLPETKSDVMQIDEKKLQGLTIKKLIEARKELKKFNNTEQKFYKSLYCGATDETQVVVVNDLNTISKMGDKRCQSDIQ